MNAHIASPFAPSPDLVVRNMLKMSNVGPSDYLIDLGSGDGRIAIAAARDFGARSLGVEIRPDLLQKSRDSAERQGLNGMVEFREEDLFATDISVATIVTAYLVPKCLNAIAPKLRLQLRPGARFCSHAYHVHTWRTSKRMKLAVTQQRRLTGEATTFIFCYQSPEAWA